MRSWFCSALNMFLSSLVSRILIANEDAFLAQGLGPLFSVVKWGQVVSPLIGWQTLSIWVPLFSHLQAISHSSDVCISLLSFEHVSIWLHGLLFSSFSLTDATEHGYFSPHIFWRCFIRNILNDLLDYADCLRVVTISLQVWLSLCLLCPYICLLINVGSHIDEEFHRFQSYVFRYRNYLIPIPKKIRFTAYITLSFPNSLGKLRVM